MDVSKSEILNSLLDEYNQYPAIIIEYSARKNSEIEDRYSFELNFIEENLDSLQNFANHILDALGRL